MRQQGFWILFAIGILFLSSIGFSQIFAEGELSFWERPENITDDSQIDSIVDRTTLLTVVYYAIVVFCLLFFCFKYKDRGERGFYHHGTDKKSVMLQFAVGALVFITVDVHLVILSSNHLQTSFFSYPAEDNKDEWASLMDPKFDEKNPFEANKTRFKGKRPLRVEMYPQQWAWNFRYAGPDNKFNTPDDIVTFNDFRVPKDRPIVVQLKAKDVIHALSLPHVRLKQDAIPGAVTRLWFECTKKDVKASNDKLELVCAEMCGLNHYKMKAEFHVLESGDFARWAQRAQKISAVAFDKDQPDALWGWKWEEYSK